jgi:branched-chain amino acid transport system permease protein
VIDGAVAGLISGGAYAIIGTLVMLHYRMVGVLNFAQAITGTLGLYVTIVLMERGVALPLAVIAGVLTGLALGLAIGAVMTRWFAESSSEARTTVTVAFLVGLVAVGFRLFGTDPRNVADLFGGASAQIGNVFVPFSALAAVGLALLLAVVLDQFLKRSVLGVRLRAIAERPTTSTLVGIPTAALSLAVWGFGGAVAALSIMLVATTRPTDFLTLGLLVLPGLAAALIGLFRSFIGVALGGLAIGVLEGVAGTVQATSLYRPAISFLLVLAVVLVLQRRERWDAAR